MHLTFGEAIAILHFKGFFVCEHLIMSTPESIRSLVDAHQHTVMSGRHLNLRTTDNMAILPAECLFMCQNFVVGASKSIRCLLKLVDSVSYGQKKKKKTNIYEYVTRALSFDTHLIQVHDRSVAWCSVFRLLLKFSFVRCHFHL